MGLSEEHRQWLALTLVPGVGSAHFIRLLARFHTPGNVLSAGAGALAEAVGKALAQRITQYGETVDVARQERLMAEYGAELVTLNDPAYPLRLAEIYDPPLVLFARGALVGPDEACVGIVGTRRASPYGIRMAEKLGRELGARGVTVVSGMAAGVDSAAHRGAIEGGGRTIAVLGNGVDQVYPPQNAELMEAIMEHGCVVSQFAMGQKPARGHFPYRNRIISGMSLGTVVVEAPLSSGALITARQAGEQGREVFAVPGQVGMRNSEGPHSLIREGAKLVETVEDILVELNLPVTVRNEAQLREARSPAPERELQQAAEAPQTSRRQRPEPQPVRQTSTPPAPSAPRAPAAPSAPRARVAGVEADVLGVLSPDGQFVDEIAAACRIPVSEALSSLTLLELKGLVRQFSGKRFALR